MASTTRITNATPRVRIPLVANIPRKPKRLFPVAAGCFALFFIGHFIYESPILLALTPVLLTPILASRITPRVRLFNLAFAFGAATVAFDPVMSVLDAGSAFQAIFAVLMLGALTALPWLLIFGGGQRRGRVRITTTCFACIIALLPPIGTIAAPSPYMTAGILFPGAGLFGLMLIALSIVAISAVRTPRGKFLGLVVITGVATLYNLSYTPAKPLDDWVAVTTHFAGSADTLAKRDARVEGIRQEITAAMDRGDRMLIFPETLLPNWSEAVQANLIPYLNRAQKAGLTILIGTTTTNTARDIGGTRENTLQVLGATNGAYQARQPAPFVMWNFWSADRYRAHWFGDGTFEIAGKRAALLICWEEWTPWAMAVSALDDPEIILTASNHGWAKPGSLMWRYQTMSAESLARLYGLAQIRAVNLPQ